MEVPDECEEALARQTLRFYDTKAQMYAEQTQGIDLTHLYEPFLKLIPRNGKILDIGCGAGRDLKQFKDEGFEAVGIDPSEMLASIAAKFSGCKVFISGVQELNFTHEFDGAWACASLIHLPRHQLPTALQKIFVALKSPGVLLISMQIGTGEMVADDGRFFTRYTSQELSDAIEAARFDLLEIWITPDSLPGRNSVVWVNAIARKLSDRFI